MKKIINAPDTVVEQMCRGIVLAHPDLKFSEKYRFIKKKILDADKVTLISGGGSGHEPAHAGFVGTGMLDAAVCGDVFASPSQVQVYQAIKQTAGKKGVLLLVKNYSGDIMNFTNAAAMAKEDGIDVEIVKIDDDIAVQDSLYTVGHRGVAGTVLVHKIAGAAAAQGMSLMQVKMIAETAVQHVKSIGFALTSCTVPAKGTPTFELNDDEMEYGVGIHGEPGIRREKLASADQLAERMVNEILSELPSAAVSQRVAVLINGFGGTPLQELYLFAHSVMRCLAASGTEVERLLVGNYMTSIDMAGASISIMRLDAERTKLLSAPCETSALHISGAQVPDCRALKKETSRTEKAVSYQLETPSTWARIQDEKLTAENIIYLVDCMSDIIITNEVAFCELDAHAGDGDFGMSVAKGFRQLKREWAEITADHPDIGSFLDSVSMIIMESCGGASGPIWGSAFRSAAKCVGRNRTITLNELADMFQAAVLGIYKTGERSFGRGAVVGDKTLIDALSPFADSLCQSAQDNIPILAALVTASKAAVAGAEQTKGIVARMGRAGTVGERSLGYPDAGAYALGVIFTQLAERMVAENS